MDGKSQRLIIEDILPLPENVTSMPKTFIYCTGDRSPLGLDLDERRFRIISSEKESRNNEK